MSNLQLTHLRFDCIATTPIKLGGHHAGNSLRNALANVIYRSVCPENRQSGTPPSSDHVATCPACWLLSANVEPGTVIRAYTIVPPIPSQWDLQPRDCFNFGLTLFGEGYSYLPYFVLAISEMGRSEGLGPGRREGLGRFDLTAISAIDPLRGDCKLMLRPGESVVTLPDQLLDWTAVSKISQHHLKNLPDNTLTIQFLTPARLEEKKHLYKIPDFSVLFRRLLYRIDELNRQFAGQPRRSREDVIRL
ncbi:MAG: hypothetical protein GY805_10580, partial [Chloroflexi bacterium]|nr:hypothetical protein [Chloroflexota bacterium]